jgi:heptosyltransferase-2/heptosyltransferase-3
MLPDPQTIPTPVPKSDPPSLRKPLRLALLRVLGASPSLRTKPGAGLPRRIVLIRPDHLGDVLCITPALRYLRATLPQAHLTALVGPWARPVLERNPYLDAVQTLEFPGFTRRSKGSPLAPYAYLWRAARQLRTQRFDAAVMLRFDHWWGALLSALAHIPQRIGYDVPEVRPFLTDIVHYETGRHEVAQNLRLAARVAGVPEPQASPWFYPLEFATSDADDATADEILRAHGISAQERFAVLVPGSGAVVKLWREDGFARVAEALAGQHKLRVIVAGAKEEHALASRIAAQSGVPLVDLTGTTTLAQLAAIFKYAVLAVGTDSGPMHLAVAMRAPSVHLFGPVSARAFGPWGDPARHMVLTSGLACIACNRLDYTGPELSAHPCVPLIAERQVLAAIESVLRSD